MWHQRVANLFFVLLLTVSSAHAGGPAGSGRWSGEMKIPAALTVPRGATLTIAAGTRVVPLANSAVITVNGRLLVEGTAAAPVVFQAPAGWQGIQFVDGDAGSRIAHARFSRAATAIVSTATLFSLANSEFHGCESAVKLVREASPVIENSWFVDNGIGIDSEMKSAPTIRGNRFSGHTQAAILASHSSRGTISGNRFVENRQGIDLIQRFDGLIADNTFNANETAIHCNQTQETPRIEGNRFEGNRLAIATVSYAHPVLMQNRFVENETAVHNDQFGLATIEHNLFRGNGTALYNNRRSSPRVRLNRFEGNRLAIFCDYSSYPEVRQNNFSGNAMGIKLGLFQSVDWERRYGSKPMVQREAAGRNGKSPLLNIASASGDALLDASNNWWGKDTAQMAMVGERGNVAIFHDGYDQPEVSYEGYGPESYLLDRIKYAPWLKDAVPGAGAREKP